MAAPANYSAIQLGVSAPRKPTFVHLHASGRIVAVFRRWFTGADRIKRIFSCQRGLASIHNPDAATFVFRLFRTEELSDWMASSEVIDLIVSAMLATLSGLG